MPRELSRTISSLTSGGSEALQLGHRAGARRAPRSMVLEPWVLTMSMASARSPFSMATFSSSCWPSTTVATWREIDRREAAAGDDQVGEMPRLGDAAGDLDDAVVVAALRRCRPGSSWFSSRTAAHHVVDADA